MARRVAAVVGVGSGLGLSIARRFAREGHIVAILARNLDKLMKLAEEIVENETNAQVAAIRIDCSDAKSVREAFEAVHSLGAVEVMVFNVNTTFPSPLPKFTDIVAESLAKSLTVPTMGAYYCVQQVLPGMTGRKKGTILFTGATASIRGGAGYAELACGKFALRALSQCLAREYQSRGIHIAHIIVDGLINNSQRANEENNKLMNPDAVAETYWQIHSQHITAWTHELDLRPYSENF